MPAPCNCIVNAKKGPTMVALLEKSQTTMLISNFEGRFPQKNGNFCNL